MSPWVIPGAPLPEGGGWRIWYSQSTEQDFSPVLPRITLGGDPVPFTTEWSLLPPIPDLNRRMGVLIVRLQNPLPGTKYNVQLPYVERDRPLSWLSMPNALSENGIVFLFGSCYWRDNDKEGAYSAAIRWLTDTYHPAFKLLVGDQLYEDWPASFPSGAKPLQRYARRYEEYWGDPAYQEALQAVPNFFLCDDHEYWNDFPERQIHLSRTWTSVDRFEYGSVAKQLYECYQRCLNPGSTLWYQFNVGPVSFFVADTRTERDPVSAGNPHFFQEQQWIDLEAWANGLRGPGVLVLGQPLYQKDGDWKDHSLSNFSEDYDRLCRLITRSHRGQNSQNKPHQILMLSGDIHTGRFSKGTIIGLGGAISEVSEFIASATSKIGPYPQTPKAELPPENIPSGTVIKTITVDTKPFGLQSPPISTDNNIGMVRMTPGTSGRVRFELTLWRVRPHDSRSAWDLLWGVEQPQGNIIPLFGPIEINLQ